MKRFVYFDDEKPKFQNATNFYQILKVSHWVHRKMEMKNINWGAVQHFNIVRITSRSEIIWKFQMETFEYSFHQKWKVNVFVIYFWLSAHHTECHLRCEHWHSHDFPTTKPLYLGALFEIENRNCLFCDLVSMIPIFYQMK